METYEYGRLLPEVDDKILFCDNTETVYPDRLAGKYYCTISILHALQIWTEAEWMRLSKWVDGLEYQRQRRLKPLFAFATILHIDDNTIQLTKELIDFVGIKDTAILCLTNVGEMYIAAPEEVSSVREYDDIRLVDRFLLRPQGGNT